MPEVHIVRKINLAGGIVLAVVLLWGVKLQTASANPGDFTPWDAGQDAANRAAAKAQLAGAQYETVQQVYRDTLQTVWAFETCRWMFEVGTMRMSQNVSAGHSYAWCMERAIRLDWDAAVIENTLLKK